MTPISKLVNILILIKFIPVKIESEIDEAHFSLLSWRSWLSVLIYFGSVVGCFVIHNLTNGESFAYLSSVMTTTGMISFVTFVLIVGVPFPLLPLSLGYSVSRTNFTWKKKKMHWPRNGWWIFVGFGFFTIAA